MWHALKDDLRDSNAKTFASNKHELSLERLRGVTFHVFTYGQPWNVIVYTHTHTHTYVVIHD